VIFSSDFWSAYIRCTAGTRQAPPGKRPPQRKNLHCKNLQKSERRTLRRILRYILGGSGGASFGEARPDFFALPPLPLEAQKMCRAKQLPVKTHLNENIHSREYNKTACRMRIFLFMQVNTEL